MPELESRKTGGLTALGVIAVILGALFFIASCWGLLQPQTHRAIIAQSGAPQLVKGITELFLYLDAAANFILSLLLFIAGVGLLRLRLWGARLATGYAIVRIAWSVIAFVFALIGPIAHRPTPEELQALREPYVNYMATRFLPVALNIIIAGAVLSAIPAVILLCLLSRKSYRERLL